MNCPPDYVPLATLLPKWNRALREGVLQGFESDISPDREFEDVKISIERFFVCAPDDTTEHSFFALIGTNLFVASRDGRVEALDSRLIDNVLTAWDVSIEDLCAAALSRGRTDLLNQVGPEGEYHLNDLLMAQFSLCPLTRSGMAFDLSYAKTVDPEITVWQLARRMDLPSFHYNIPPFYERIGYRLTLQPFDLATELGMTCDPVLHGIVEGLRPFEGWAMCVPREIAQGQRWSQRVAQAKSRSPRSRKSAGRPAIQQEALREAYQIKYSSGHGAKKPKELLGELNPALVARGIEAASVQTLKRMLKSLHKRN